MTKPTPKDFPDLPPVADRAEVMRLLSWLARNGSVVAAKLLLEELNTEASQVTEPPESHSIIDELARRREEEYPTPR